MQSRRVAAAVICAWVSLPTLASADTWDINVGRLCQIHTTTNKVFDCGGGYTTAVAQTDPVASVVADNVAFRSLMSELGAVFAPNILYTADTRGWSGFNIATEFGWTQVNSTRQARDPNITTAHYFWRAAGSVSPQAFADPDPSHRDDTRFRAELPPSMAPTVTLMARKGLWFPVPSFELGVGVRHLIGSSMWAPLATAKIALHEGFHGWPIPSLAVRGMGAQVMNTPGFNLTLAALDVSASKRFGIASTFNLTPYAGYQLLWVIATSQVIDATPAIDAIALSVAQAGGDPLKLTGCSSAVPDCKANFTFAPQSSILRHRFFMGLKANFYIFALTAEYTFFASGATSDSVVEAATGNTVPVADASGVQHTFALALGLDY